MITLTLNVPAVTQILAQGYTQIVVSKAAPQSEYGVYSPVGAAIPLVSGTMSYSFIDVAGGYADWYQTQYQIGSGTLSAYSNAQPGYFSDLTNTIRDVLGVQTTHVSDSQIQGFAYLPSALARIRQRFPAFDTTIASGGDAGALCLGALAHLTAAFLCPRMTVQVVDSEQFDRYRYQLNRQMDWTATQSELMAQYEILISQAAGETDIPTTSYVPGVLVAGPTSSGQDNAGGLVPFQPDPFENPLLPYNPDLNPY